jgi:hypothetical protein
LWGQPPILRLLLRISGPGRSQTRYAGLLLEFCYANSTRFTGTSASVMRPFTHLDAWGALVNLLRGFTSCRGGVTGAGPRRGGSERHAQRGWSEGETSPFLCGSAAENWFLLKDRWMSKNCPSGLRYSRVGARKYGVNKERWKLTMPRTKTGPDNSSAKVPQTRANF